VETATNAEFLFQHALPQQQRERLLDQFLADVTFHLALAADERHDVLGIDYHRPGADADEPEITARLCADAWALNGHKRRVANAPLAKLFVIESAIDNGDRVILLVP